MRYQLEAYRVDPTNLETISWLGAHHVRQQVGQPASQPASELGPLLRTQMAGCWWRPSFQQALAQGLEPGCCRLLPRCLLLGQWPAVVLAACLSYFMRALLLPVCCSPLLLQTLAHSCWHVTADLQDYEAAIPYFQAAAAVQPKEVWQCKARCFHPTSLAVRVAHHAPAMHITRTS